VGCQEEIDVDFLQVQSILTAKGPVTSIMRDEERQYIWDVCQILPNGEIVEVGVFSGGTTLLLHHASNRTIHAVDDWVGERYDDFNRTMSNYKIPHILHHGSSWNMARDFEDSSCALVLIDAGHEGEAPYEDIVAWSPKVKVGGYLLVDDSSASFPDVTLALFKFKDLWKYNLVYAYVFTEVGMSHRFIKLVSFLRVSE